MTTPEGLAACLDAGAVRRPPTEATAAPPISPVTLLRPDLAHDPDPVVRRFALIEVDG